MFIGVVDHVYSGIKSILLADNRIEVYKAVKTDNVFA